MDKKDDPKVYDDVFKTLIAKCSQLLIPIINDVFKTQYTSQDQIIELREEQHYTDLKFKRKSQAVDSYVQICENYYHLECQSSPDRTMIFRMMNYDFQFALENRELMEQGRIRIKYPESAVFYLRCNKGTPDQMIAEIEFQNNNKIYLTIPCIKIDDFTEKDLVEKNWLFFIPFYIIRYEKQMNRMETDLIFRKRVYQEYEYLIRTLLQKEADQEIPLGYVSEIEELNDLIIHHVTKNYKEIREELIQMGGTVLRTRTDELIDKGVHIGVDKGVVQERLHNIRRCMEKKKMSFDEAYDSLQDLFDYPEEERESYRQKCQKL